MPKWRKRPRQRWPLCRATTPTRRSSRGSPQAEGKTLAVLIELVGQRRIDATPALVKALDHPDAAVRSAALTALGATVGAKDFPC